MWRIIEQNKGELSTMTSKNLLCFLYIPCFLINISILQVALTQLTFLPSNNTAANQKELILARDVLEIGAQWSVATKDVKAFERYMSQLKCYYFDYK